jgi:hypothetical protein
MHPNVVGKEGDRCHLCGMPLAPASAEPVSHEGHP